MGDLAADVLNVMTAPTNIKTIKEKALKRERFRLSKLIAHFEEAGDDATHLVKQFNALPLTADLDSKKSTLTIRTAADIIRMTFDDADNYFGDRVIAQGQAVTLLGPGGVGKSRLVTQLALCMITGRDFITIPTHAKGKKWLIVQTENSNRRLHHDITSMLLGMNLTHEEGALVQKCLIIHTLEKDEDAFLDVDSPEDFQNLVRLIQDLNPDFVVFDPLNTFTSGDLNSDRDMRAVLTKLTQATKKGNPHRVPFVLHHSLTGKTGAGKGVGWDKASYGRNSKVLQAWTRAQINIIPQDPDDPDKLVLACGKNNNGKLFADTGIIFDESIGLYRVDPGFNSDEFREEIGITKSPKKETILISSTQVTDLVDGDVERPELVKRIMREFGCSQRSAYNAVDKAEAGRFILRRKGVTWKSVYYKALLN